MKYKTYHSPLLCQTFIKTDGITQSKSINFPSISNKTEDRAQTNGRRGNLRVVLQSRPKQLPRRFRGARPAQDLPMYALVHRLSL